MSVSTSWLLYISERRQTANKDRPEGDSITIQAVLEPLSHQLFFSSCESLLCFFMGQKRPFCSISNICDALPSPLTRQYVRLCHTLFSAALLKLIQEVCMGIRSGVSNQSCVSCEGTSHVRLPHTKPVCSPVSAPTLGWTPC